MAKKKTASGSGFKAFISSFIEKSLQNVIQTVAEHATHITQWIKYLPVLKQRIKHMVAAAVFAIAGILLVGFGIAEYAVVLVPELANGISHIIVGLILLVAAMLYVRS